MWWRSVVNFSFFLCLAACRMRSSACDTVARFCARSVLCWLAFPSAPALGSTDSAADRSALFVGFTATTAGSDFSRSCIIGYGSSPFRCGPWGRRVHRPNVRPPRFRRLPFVRDVFFDHGRASVPRIAGPHMLPSTLLTGSASAVLWLSRLNSTPHTIAVYASHPPSPATTQHSLPGARYGLPGPVSHRQEHASFAWRTSNPSRHKERMDCFVALLLAMTVSIHSLLPGKHRLFQLGHAGIAACQHFAELVDQRRRGRVDELAGVTKPDHAPRAFGNGGEVERVGPFDIAKRDAVYRGDFFRVRRDCSTRVRPHHDRRDEIAGARGIIVEQTQNIRFAEFKAEFLVQLAQRRRDLCLALVAAPARQCPLTAVSAQPRSAQGQQHSRSARRIAGERDGDSGPFQRKRGFTGRQSRKRRTTLCDIPPGGMVEWPSHPA